MADFIAENFIIIVIIIGGILSLFKNKSNPSEDERQRAGNPAAPGSQKRNHPSASHSRSTNSRTGYTPPTMNKQNPVSIEEQKKKQLEELQKRMGGSSMAVVQEEEDNSHQAGLESNLRSPTIVKPYHHREFRNEIKGKLNRKGLIDSIVMAEVLGPPRAKKPYSSIISQKK